MIESISPVFWPKICAYLPTQNQTLLLLVNRYFRSAMAEWALQSMTSACKVIAQNEGKNDPTREVVVGGCVIERMQIMQSKLIQLLSNAREVSSMIMHMDCPFFVRFPVSLGCRSRRLAMKGETFEKMALEAGRRLPLARLELLRCDREVVLARVQKCGYQLKDAAESLQDDDAIVQIALNGDFLAYAFASKRLQEVYRSQMLKEMQNVGQILPEHQDETNWVRRAVLHNGLALKFASLRLRTDFVTACIAVNANRLAIVFVDASIQRDVAEAVAERAPNQAKDVAEHFEKDSQFVRKRSGEAPAAPFGHQ